jgi:hypothetical protein
MFKIEVTSPEGKTRLLPTEYRYPDDAMAQAERIWLRSDGSVLACVSVIEQDGTTYADYEH